MVTGMPLRQFVDGPLKYLGVFIGFLETIHGYASFREVSADLLAYLKRDIVNNREHLSMRKCDNFTRDHFI